MANSIKKTTEIYSNSECVVQFHYDMLDEILSIGVNSKQLSAVIEKSKCITAIFRVKQWHIK